MWETTKRQWTSQKYINSVHWTLNIEHWTLNTEHCTLNTEQWTLNTQSIFRSLQWICKVFYKFPPEVPLGGLFSPRTANIANYLLSRRTREQDTWDKMNPCLLQTMLQLIQTFSLGIFSSKPSNPSPSEYITPNHPTLLPRNIELQTIQPFSLGIYSYQPSKPSLSGYLAPNHPTLLPRDI